MFKALAATVLAMTVATAGSALAQSPYGQSTFGQSTYNAAKKQDTYVYCTASDGHYTLYSGIFGLRGRQISEITSAWRNYTKTAKPRLEFGDDATTGGGSCSTVLAEDAYQAANAEALSASALQRDTRSVRSFGTAWTY